MKAILLTLSIIISLSHLKAQKNCAPILKFGEHTESCSISKDELSQGKLVFTTCPDWIIVSFEFTKKSPHVSYINLGNKFSTEILKELKNIKTNDIIYLENVKAKGPDGVISNVPGMTIKVIN